MLSRLSVWWAVPLLMVVSPLVLGETAYMPNTAFFSIKKAAEELHDPSSQFLVGHMYLHGQGIDKDARKAAKWFYKAAELGHAKALYALGELYRDGVGVQVDSLQAIVYFKLAARRKHVDAYFALAQLYQRSKGKQKDLKKAAAAYMRAAKRGHVKAQLALAKLYLAGKGVLRDKKAALKLLHLAADYGDSEAQYLLGIAYAGGGESGGNGPKKDLVKAEYWLKMAAKQNYKKAQRRLATLRLMRSSLSGISKPPVYLLNSAPVYQTPLNRRLMSEIAVTAGATAAPSATMEQTATLPKNSPVLQSTIPKSAIVYTPVVMDLSKSTPVAAAANANTTRPYGNVLTAVKDKIAAAHAGDRKTQYELGLMYFNGENVAKNIDEGLHWLIDSGQNGHADAQFALGNIFRQGLTTPRNLTRAFHWYRMAAEQGHARAQYQLAMLYEQGLGVDSDKSAAKSWLQKALYQGEGRAFTALKRLNDNDPSRQRAAPQFSVAGQQKKPPVAVPNLQNVQVKLSADVSAAMNHTLATLLAAADAGKVAAQMELGNIYQLGTGVTRDYNIAARWYLKAAENGAADAQYRLGIMYHQGLGVPKDNAQAAKWFRRAAKKGHAAARQKLGGCTFC